MAAGALQAVTSSLTSLRATATRLDCRWRPAEALQRTLYAYTHQQCTFHPAQVAFDIVTFKLGFVGLLRDGGASVPALTGRTCGLKCMAARNGCGSPISLGDAAKTVGLSQLRTQTALCCYAKYCTWFLSKDHQVV